MDVDFDVVWTTKQLNKNKHSSSGGQGDGEPDFQTRGDARSIIINLTNIWKILKKNPKPRTGSSTW